MAVVFKEDPESVSCAPKVHRPATRGRKLIQGNAMLVLSRKVGERILIGDQVAVTIVRVSGGGVRVGIEAPADMAVLRAEILEQKSSENLHPAETQQSATSFSEIANLKITHPQAETSVHGDEAVALPTLEEKPLRKAR